MALNVTVDRASVTHVIAGLVLVALAITLATFLVASVVRDTTWAGLLAASIGGWYASWWFVLPIVERRRAVAHRH